MLDQTKLFNNTYWKESYITPKLDFMIDDGKNKAYVRFDTKGSEYETPDNLKQPIKQIGQQIIPFNGGIEVPPVLEEVENQINDFVSRIIKNAKNNSNNKFFDSRLIETLKGYRKLNPEYIISTNDDHQVIAFYEIVSNS